MPERNKKDLVDVPKKVLADLKIVPVTHMDDVLKVALYPDEDRPANARFRVKDEEEASQEG